MTDRGTLLFQLPLHPGCGFEPTGNIPLAPGRIAAAAGLCRESVVPAHVCDRLSDSEILSLVARVEPSLVGFTLYMWNAERSAWLSERISRLLPSVFTVAGGPEVSADNRWLIESGAFDLLVEGEGEPFAEALNDLKRLSRIRERHGGLTTTGRCTFLPDYWPDPYFTGHLEGSLDLPCHLETVRGCPHRCAYCAYRRICPEPRVTPAWKVLETMKRHREAGRSELVFLDPTFNGRPDLQHLLAGMRGMGFSCFGEVRAGLSSLSAPAIAEAGFHSVEVGLQTMNKRVLRELGRLDDPEKTIRGALSLKASGVEPVVDLILGLPGDRPDGILKAGERLAAEGLEAGVQAFFLSVLPGTELRRNGDRLGLSIMDLPPYWVTGLPGITLRDLADARYELGSILGFDLDMEPRPVLCDRWPNTAVLDLNRNEEPVFSGRHCVLRVRGDDPWGNRLRILASVEARFRSDPFCVLDVVFEAARHFPLDLLALVADARRPLDYHDRSASVLGRQGRLRTAVIAGFDSNFHWLRACASETVVAAPWNASKPAPMELLENGIGLLFEGRPDLSLLAETLLDHRELVFFREPDMERLWCLDILELG